MANPPALTSLSQTAVVVSSERAIGGVKVPLGLMANMWGSRGWGVVNRLGADSSPSKDHNTTMSPLASPKSPPRTSQDDVGVMDHAVGPSVAVDKLEDSRLVAEDDVEEGFGADGEVAGQESLHAYVHVVNCYPGISAGIRGRLTLWRIVDGLRRQLTA